MDSMGTGTQSSGTLSSFVLVFEIERRCDSKAFVIALMISFLNSTFFCVCFLTHHSVRSTKTERSCPFVSNERFAVPSGLPTKTNKLHMKSTDAKTGGIPICEEVAKGTDP